MSAQALQDATRRATESYDDRIGVLEELQGAIMEEQASLRVMTAQAPGGLRKDLDDNVAALWEYVAAVETNLQRTADVIEALATRTRRSRRQWAKLQAARTAAEETSE